MVAKVVKLAVIPAALGLASFRVYAMTEDRTDGRVSPQELSVYSADPPALHYVEERAGRLQSGIGLMRARLQSYVRAVQNTCTSVKVRAISLYQTGQDTYNFLRDPPPGFLPRVGIITVSGLSGLILARKGSRIKRIGVPLVMTSVGAAVCYPLHTVAVLQVTGKKVYSATSFVASAFKSDSKVAGVVPDHAPEEAAPGTEAPVSVVTHVSPAQEKDLAPSEVALDSERTPQEDTTPGDITHEVVTNVSETTASEKPFVADVKPDAAPETAPPEAVVDTEETTPPLPPATASPAVEETPLPPATASPAVEETPLPPATASPAVEETTPPPANEKPRFAPDPSLLDHGQAHPEDADLYSTRG
ncbi:MICOS complex subunit MIC27 isoform X2 [Hemibagrus wyckioides]|uniref:MICOS complex subunit MIC27 isoform X2 n=1 Tax=Hemibagrus wyckioides TaxID=337641 RepID=UPI00266B5A34|nr:MICOS complex subunit MIC27 isoform X2 [Hemibagrus wyckioides]